jgi:hypothetical protein
LCFRKLQTDSSYSQVPGLRPTGSQRKKRTASSIQERTRQNPVDRVLAQRARRAEANINQQPPSQNDAETRNGGEHSHGQQPRISAQPTTNSNDHRQPPRPRSVILQPGSENRLPRHNGLRHDERTSIEGIEDDVEDKEAREEEEEQIRRRHAEKHEPLARQQPEGLEKTVARPHSESLPPRCPSLTVKTNSLPDSGELSSGKKRVSLPFLFYCASSTELETSP